MPERYSRIFLLSHMRAFTSLAGHILGSHPQINGYFEMHISYDDGKEELIQAGEVFYFPAGHTGWSDEEVAWIEFSPEKEMNMVMDHIGKKMQGMAQ